MTEYEKIVNRRHKAGDILVTNKSADVKLFEVFQLYKEDLKKKLYTILLRNAWMERCSFKRIVSGNRCCYS